MTDTATGKIAFLGFGEAARAFLEGWRSQASFSAEVVAFDIKTDSHDAAVRAKKLAEYTEAGVEGAESAAQAVEGAAMVFSVVTADQAHHAALAALSALAPGALFFDCNSCAPQTKVKSAAIVEEAGGAYVDVAVMAPVHPRLHRTPLLISGPRAEAAVPVLRALDMAPAVQSGPVGSSSAIKMVRSVMMKGLEALVCECVLAGRKAGVDELVLASLDDTYPGFDWKKRSAYMLERAMTHGVRRAAEMREVALTVELLGFGGAMSRATAEWEQKIGDLRLNAREGDVSDYRSLADMILAKYVPEAEG